MKKSVSFWVQASLIAALYVTLVMVFSFSSFGPIQFRVAEALTVLPFFTPAAVPGLFVGCLIANILGGAVIWDIIFGSLATLIAALLSYYFRKNKWLVPIPPVLVNTVIVAYILKFAYGMTDGIWVLMSGVFLGQMVSAFGIGLILIHALSPVKKYIFKENTL